MYVYAAHISVVSNRWSVVSKIVLLGTKLFWISHYTINSYQLTINNYSLLVVVNLRLKYTIFENSLI
ncbi:hypothetical protein SAMN04487911_11861 [Arenibacter nanhaiticus]|uniref:Uncharacterized protein n=1 Tax=Arenibacter nanhaiticus TaxID=558155 RepID=A0A1M6INI2_9FLAO|nr:hypothetical protein SAMN04487911_11861 [Arenibacter nanhaiticus]